MPAPEQMIGAVRDAAWHAGGEPDLDQRRFGRHGDILRPVDGGTVAPWRRDRHDGHGHDDGLIPRGYSVELEHWPLKSAADRETAAARDREGRHPHAGPVQRGKGDADAGADRRADQVVGREWLPAATRATPTSAEPASPTVSAVHASAGRSCR